MSNIEHRHRARCDQRITAMVPRWLEEAVQRASARRATSLSNLVRETLIDRLRADGERLPIDGNVQ